MITVLRVEDDSHLRNWLRWLLQDRRHDVLGAENGIEALQILQDAVHPLVSCSICR